MNDIVVEEESVEELTPEQVAEHEEKSDEEAEAAFKAGFERVEGESSNEDEEEELEEEVADEESEVDVAAAIAAAAEKTESERAEQEASEKAKAIEALPNRMRNIEGHIGGIKSALEKLQTAQAAAPVITADSTKEERKIAASLKNPKAMEEMVEELDELRPVLDELQAIREDMAALGQASPALDEVSRKMDELSRRSEQAERQHPIDIEQAKELAKLELKHSNWKEDTSSAEFKQFLLNGGPSENDYDLQHQMEMEGTEDAQRQAQEMMMGWAQKHPDWWVSKGHKVFSSHADDNIALLDSFHENKEGRTRKEAEEAEERKKRERLEGAITPKGTQVSATTGLSDRQAFKKGFDRVRRLGRA